MKHQTFNSFRKKHPLFAIVPQLPNPNPASISNAYSLIELLNKYGMVNGHITAENYEIFRNKDIIETFDEFIIHNLSDSRPLKSVAITQHVSHGSCLEDFDTIYQDLLRNIDNIIHFQNKFNIEISINIHVKAFDSEKAIAVSNFIVNNGIDYSNFIFDFPPLNKNFVFSLISNIEQLCVNPILKNTKIRLVNFPFCFIPAAKYKCLYRHIINTFKGNISLQEETIRELKKKKFTYFKPCQMCRCRVPCYTYTNIQQHPEYSLFLSPRTQNTVVFVGGSLQETERYIDDDIVYASPAEQGDMFMAILEGFENIIIIDGYFYSKFPCTTFGVMLALEQGIKCLRVIKYRCT